MKELYVKDIKLGETIESNFMIKKILNRNINNITAYIGDKTGDIKAVLPEDKIVLNVGDVIKIQAVAGNILEATYCIKLESVDLSDYVPMVSRNIDDIMKEIEEISLEEFKSKEALALNDYFFKDEKFIDKFKKAIGGVSQHHNYIGGLAEHTLNVMYMSKMLSYRYNARNKEIAILSAKLHDIGKIDEMKYNGPFGYTLRGDMEGHIVIGITMLEKAFDANPDIYSEDFKARVKGCIVQHHGKLEYGSPKTPNTEEAYIVHFSDYIDATFNKIEQIKKELEPNMWSDYDRRIEGRLYI